ncbi:molybdopterin-binding protein [uncultured Tateyamaria sp.]|uniref:molybdopterin-binding protein n=1 Tax=Tateyamaria sp. 1078 TaxID=3417464 RepID=UPI002637DA27|nr:molybdopterin-binding protein [uncultured Tateyamaria sp.]
MIFGPVPVGQAQGTVLAHAMVGARGKITKGTVLDAAQVAALAEAGHDTLIVARLEPGDVNEDAAAAALAATLVPDPDAQRLRISGAGAGRVNLYATGPGIVALDRAAITALNAVDPMITLATVPPWHRVDAGTMVATIKIISYAVPQAALTRAQSASPRALSVLPPRYATATLIETRVGPTAPTGKGRAALTGRLDRLGLALGPRIMVAHDTNAIAEALRDAPGEVLFVLTASATSDPHDVAPAALRAAGGHVEAYGMPVDPGNLLFLGHLGDKPVIGLPGCARSPALNGADWVMERLICGLALTRADIADMGVGGLLKEIPTRPRPREG